MAIVLPDLLDVKHVDLNLGPRSPENVVRELIGLLTANEQLREADLFLQQVLERERVSPSVVEHEVAFPHARTDVVEKIVLAVGRSRSGVPFEKDGPRARLIFLIGVPRRLISDYLVCVGALARLTKSDDIRKQLMQAPTAEAFVEILRSGPEYLNLLGQNLQLPPPGFLQQALASAVQLPSLTFGQASHS